MNEIFSTLLTFNIFIAGIFLFQRISNFYANKIQLTHGQTLIYSKIVFVFSIIIFIYARMTGAYFMNVFHHVDIPQFVQHFSRIGRIDNNTFDLAREPYDVIIQNNQINWQKWLAIFTVLVGIMLYFQQLYRLKKILKSIGYQRRLGSVNLVYSDKNVQPQCFTYLKSSYVILPLTLLDNHEELNVVIKHELQHLRQNDGWLLHLLATINIFCWWNPIYGAYVRCFTSMQEFACDEAITMNKRLSTQRYAQILLSLAKKVSDTNAVNLNLATEIFSNTSQLKRRINMLSKHKIKHNRYLVLGMILFLFMSNGIAAFALNTRNNVKPLTLYNLQNLVSQLPNNQLQVKANKKVLNALNAVITDPKLRSAYKAGLQRMKNYQQPIRKQLGERKLPSDLLAIPLLESRYQPLVASKHQPNVAGIWQLEDTTAKRYGINVNGAVDERLKTEAATRVALAYLKDTHQRFQNWSLAIISYDAGVKRTEKLLHLTRSNDPWKVISHKNISPEVKQYLPMVDASIIILHNPNLVQ